MFHTFLNTSPHPHPRFSLVDLYLRSTKKRATTIDILVGLQFFYSLTLLVNRS